MNLYMNITQHVSNRAVKRIQYNRNRAAGPSMNSGGSAPGATWAVKTPEWARAEGRRVEVCTPSPKETQTRPSSRISTTRHGSQIRESYSHPAVACFTARNGRRPGRLPVGATGQDYHAYSTRCGTHARLCRRCATAPRSDRSIRRAQFQVGNTVHQVGHYAATSRAEISRSICMAVRQPASTCGWVDLTRSRTPAVGNRRPLASALSSSARGPITLRDAGIVRGAGQ